MIDREKARKERWAALRAMIVSEAEPEDREFALIAFDEYVDLATSIHRIALYAKMKLLTGKFGPAETQFPELLAEKP